MHTNYQQNRGQFSNHYTPNEQYQHITQTQTVVTETSQVETEIVPSSRRVIPVRRIDPYSVDPVYCCVKIPVRCAIWLIVVFEILSIVYSVVYEILPHRDLNKRIRKNNPLEKYDGSWIFTLRVLFLAAMYLMVAVVFFYHFAVYLSTRGDGMRDEPEHRRILIKGMDLLLIRTIAEPAMLIISNIIIANVVNQKVIFIDFKWQLVIGLITLILILWWRSAFQKYYIQLVPNVSFTGIQIVDQPGGQQRSLFDFIEAPLPNPSQLPT